MTNATAMQFLLKPRNEITDKIRLMRLQCNFENSLNQELQQQKIQFRKLPKPINAKNYRQNVTNATAMRFQKLLKPRSRGRNCGWGS